MNKKTGFTLVELMIVIGIICLLSALTFPVLGRAKRSALAVSGVSNMRQLGAAVVMYMEANGDTSTPPTLKTAYTLVQSKVDCDPLDTWRSSCQETSSRPMLGSFGYTPDVAAYSIESAFTWSDFVADCPNPPLLVDPFSVSPVTCEWYAGLIYDHAWAAACASKGGDFAISPSKFVRYDLSIGIERPHRRIPATWGAWLGNFDVECRSALAPGT